MHQLAGVATPSIDRPHRHASHRANLVLAAAIPPHRGDVDRRRANLAIALKHPAIAPGVARAVAIAPDGVGDGTADSSALVYGCSGRSYNRSRDVSSTILPTYMTATRSEMWRTTDRSWAMNRYVRLNWPCSSSSRLMTCAWIDTSRAEIGSSH